MSIFIWKGKDPQGVFRAERVEAENAQDAKAILSEKGWTDLVLVSDELGDLAGRSTHGPGDQEDFREFISADEEAHLFEGRFPGFWSQYTKALWTAKVPLVLAFLWTAWGIYRNSLWMIILGALGLGALLFFFPLLFAFFSLPMQYYTRLNRAKVWSRWDEVLLCVERLRQAHRITRLGVGEIELVRNRAHALAATGRLEQGLAEFSQFEKDPALPNWNYQSFLSGIYDTAKEYEKALECRKKAVEEKPDTSAVWIDLAYGLVRGLNRPAEAREALARAEALEITQLGVPYVSFLKGLICWREGKFGEATTHLESSLPGFQQYIHSPLVEGLILLVKAHLCAVHRALGETEKAQRYFKETEVFLKAAREDELLRACGAAS
jgi:tetratricopeptide (TPR) repeat protein